MKTKAELLKAAEGVFEREAANRFAYIEQRIMFAMYRKDGATEFYQLSNREQALLRAAGFTIKYNNWFRRNIYPLTIHPWTVSW